VQPEAAGWERARGPARTVAAPRAPASRYAGRSLHTWPAGQQFPAMTIIISIVAAVVVIGFAVSLYNKLIKLKVAVQEGLAQIDVQLQRRSDLIPNLVETVKGYASHEREALESVVTARAMGLGANTVAEKAAADNVLTGALRGLLAVAEAYPDLKASANFISLQEELAGTENKIAFARQRYNDQVRELNTAIETIPTRFMAGVAKASPAEYYEAEDAARTVPKVEF
jgi:LemA protein